MNIGYIVKCSSSGGGRGVRSRNVPKTLTRNFAWSRLAELSTRMDHMVSTCVIADGVRTHTRSYGFYQRGSLSWKCSVGCVMVNRERVRYDCFRSFIYDAPSLLRICLFCITEFCIGLS